MLYLDQAFSNTAGSSSISQALLLSMVGLEKHSVSKEFSAKKSTAGWCIAIPNMCMLHLSAI